MKIPERMKVLQIEAPGRAAWKEAPVPVPAAGEVLVRILGVTTCPHWDLHILGGQPMFPGMKLVYPYFPGQPGHEAVGEVVALGAGVKTPRIGARVAVWKDTGARPHGCYAHYNTLRVVDVIEVPKTLALAQVASLELAMCVEVSFQQLARLGGVAGRRIGVAGLGPAGLLAVQLAKAHGAREVVGIDMVASRRALARKLGADRTCAPNAKAWKADRGDARVLDDAIDCTGLPASIEFLMDRTLRCVTIFGVLREEVRFSMRHWYPGLLLMGYSDHNRMAAETALKFIRQGKLDLRPLVSKTLPFTRYAEGVELLKTKKAIKILFDPWAE
ncbi:MAG: zinc-binding dehydrogenase [Opitutaceae bacterium]|nr:zinc-binding dehydrogenase [Opitutaceae bacterium]